MLIPVQDGVGGGRSRSCQLRAQGRNHPGQGALPAQAALTPAPTPAHSHPHSDWDNFHLMIHLMCTLFLCLRKQSTWRKPTHLGWTWKFQVDRALDGNWFFFLLINVITNDIEWNSLIWRPTGYTCLYTCTYI